MITQAAPFVFVSHVESHAIRAAFDGHRDALVVADPQLRGAFFTHLLPLLRECVPAVRPLPASGPAGDGVVVAFGGGATMDAAKLRAAELGLDWIAIPAKPTAAAFSASASAKDEHGVVTTTFVSPPRQILILPEVLARTPLPLLEAEIADTWSFQTAVADVALDGLVNGREWDEDVVPVCNAATRLLAPLHAAGLRSPAAAGQLLDVQRMLARLTDGARTTRYVSGTEHLIAHGLAARGCMLPHGLLVGVGIVLGRLLQDSVPSARAELTARGFEPMPDHAGRRLATGARRAITTGRLSQAALRRAVLTSRFIRLDHRHTVLDMVGPRQCRATVSRVCEEQRCS